jgi:hypothetical protein
MAPHKIIEIASDDDFGHLEDEYDALTVHKDEEDFDSMSDFGFEDYDVMILFD